MCYRTFVVLSTGGMLLGSVALALMLAWIDLGGNLTIGVLASVVVTLLVLVLDLLLWRFVPRLLEETGFQQGNQTPYREYEYAG